MKTPTSKAHMSKAELEEALKTPYLPLPDGRDMRKLLFDRADLDRLIESWKN